MFVIRNFDNFLTNTAVYGVNTRSKHQLHRPTVTVSCTQRGVFYSGIKIFNKLPPFILKLKMRPQDLWWHGEIILLLTPFILLMSFYLAGKLLFLLNINNGTIIIDVESL
jgi:hypothetical protein